MDIKYAHYNDKLTIAKCKYIYKSMPKMSPMHESLDMCQLNFQCIPF